MAGFPKPIIYSSKCLGFCNCWWNGTIIFSEFIEKIKPFVEFVTHCPEVELGLGSPRDFVRIVWIDDRKHFVQPANERDLTNEMNEYTKKTVGGLGRIDGFVLREGSPSCSIKGVKYYKGVKPGSPYKGTGPGIFGAEVLSKFEYHPIETDGRLKNAKIRDDFLTKMFLLAGFRELLDSKKIGGLIDFHARNKYLLMAFGQKYVRSLGKIVGEQKKNSDEQTFTEYHDTLLQTITANPQRKSIINTFMKMFGYFSKQLTKPERQHFLERLEQYRIGKTTLATLREILRLWILRFDDDYIKQQTIFEPYPNELKIICGYEEYEKEMKRE